MNRVCLTPTMIYLAEHVRLCSALCYCGNMRAFMNSCILQASVSVKRTMLLWQHESFHELLYSTG